MINHDDIILGFLVTGSGATFIYSVVQIYELHKLLRVHTKGATMTTVEVEYDETIEAYHLKFIVQTGRRNNWDAIQGMVGVIKALVPVSNREFNPATKIWTVLKADYEDKIGMIFNTSTQFHVVEVKKAKAAPKPEDFFYSYSAPTSSSQESKESLADKLVKLLECSTEDLGDSAKLKKLYRSKALQYHPDRNNGDGSKMSELNSVWSAYNA